MHLEHFALIVDDYDAAIEFFVGVLGFELVEDSASLTNDGRPKRWVVVRPPAGAYGAAAGPSRRRRAGAGSGDQFAGRVGLFLRVDDFETYLERLRSAGVQFLTEPRDEPWTAACSDDGGDSTRLTVTVESTEPDAFNADFGGGGRPVSPGAPAEAFNNASSSPVYTIGFPFSAVGPGGAAPAGIAFVGIKIGGADCVVNGIIWP